MSVIAPSLSLFKIISHKGPNIYDIHTERRWGVLKICCLFTGSIVFKQHIFGSFLLMGDGCGGQKLIIFCGWYNYMIPKVMFLALVPVLQWSSRLTF